MPNKKTSLVDDLRQAVILHMQVTGKLQKELHIAVTPTFYNTLADHLKGEPVAVFGCRLNIVDDLPIQVPYSIRVGNPCFRP